MPSGGCQDRQPCFQGIMDLSQDSWLNVSPDEGRQHTPWHEDDETQATGADTARLLGSARTRDTLVDDAQDVLRLGEAEGHDEYGEEDDELFLGLDEDLPAGEILSRIEHAVAQLVEDISAWAWEGSIASGWMHEGGRHAGPCARGMPVHKLETLACD